MPTPDLKTDCETIIWGRLLEAQTETQKRELSPDVARFLLSMGFAERDRERISWLADRSETGKLTPSEAAELLARGQLADDDEVESAVCVGVAPLGARRP